jgi:hypothetical protein
MMILASLALTYERAGIEVGNFLNRYPDSHKITIRYPGDRRDGRLLGVQLVGHLRSEIAKRIDVPATAIFNEMTIDALADLDLSYTPPLGSPWDALQAGAQAWTRRTLPNTAIPRTPYVAAARSDVELVRVEAVAAWRRMM